VNRPDPGVLAGLGTPLTKAPTVDPVIAGSAGRAGPASRSGMAGGSGLTKLTIRLDEELLGRARAAFFADGPGRGFSSISAWLADVIEAKVTEVEAQVNGGRPFEPVGTDVLPKGRMGRTL